AVDQFNVYASGGTRIFSNTTATAGVLLAPGGGSWSSVSDRAAKENLVSIEAQEVLDRVCALAITTWNYKAQDDSIRHMGPMAQDFHSAFGLGVSDKTIDTIDPDGVALAAIQGLNARMKAVVATKDGEIAELRERVTRLESVEAEVASLRAALEALFEDR
ncbi:MAG: tail fiber domain-containing protein, partial [Planctomycetes bacterium]|nr:tail fiber domain-containing protein [Planctomycetota bacterium]